MLVRKTRRIGITVASCVALGVVASVLQPPGPAAAAVDSMTINMASYGGTPTYRASGFIYGVSENASSPPVSTTDQIKVKVMRGGGSQLGCPNGGWVNGQYDRRWNWVRNYYNRAQRTGARMEMIVAPLWGSDGVCNVPRWPGDNGNWTDYTNFVNRIIADVRAAGMTGSNLRWDLWNEPNIFFWGRSQAQYLEMIRRGTQLIRAAIPGAVIVGPSTAGGPGNSWWDTYLDYVRANNVVPDIISWHNLPGDPAADRGTINSKLSSRGISVQGFSVNEYGAFGAEQQPGPSAWYIARLERCGCDGARANWGMVGQTPSLHDTLGWLTTANAGQPMGQWWVYKRYADQTGQRTQITAGSSHDGTVFQDSGARRSIAVLGARTGAATGAIDVRYNNIPSWLVANGSVNVRVERMPSTNAYVSAPTTVSTTRATVSGNSILVTINWTNADDAYAVTLTP
ncbi:beta-xylosidase [Plantactinospora veratri]|uniref:Beta-xylosidase n=1 Tax=Plantactinospora veratri TaxID=1436122 RepID=A0ABU7SL71_9ACTN